MSFTCSQCGFALERPGRCETHGTVLVDAVARAEAPNDRMLGTDLAGKYALVGILGRGAFGHVYRAWQEVLDRQVAIKVIRRSKAQGASFRERFFLEARAVGRLRGPNIVTLHDFGEEPDGRLYMVLELVEGPNLRQAIPNGARIEPARAARLVLPVLRALAEAHGQGIVHRDIKPSNLMLTVDDEGNETVKVLDFGVAKVIEPGGAAPDRDRRMTQHGQVVGTPRYVSPEQAAGADVGPASDLYSLGVILYELMAGRPPFQGADATETVGMRIHQPAPPLPPDVAVSPELQEVVLRALERVPAERYATAGAFAEALRATPELRSNSEVDRAGVFASAPTALITLAAEDSASGAESSGALRSAVGGTPPDPESSFVGLGPSPERRRVLAVLLLLTVLGLAGLAFLLLSRAPAPSPGGPAAPAVSLPPSAALPSTPPTAAPTSAPPIAAPAPTSAPPAPASKRPPRPGGGTPKSQPDIPYL